MTVSVQAPPAAAGGWRWNTEPAPQTPPAEVVPYSALSFPMTRPVMGTDPSPFWPVKLYRIFRAGGDCAMPCGGKTVPKRSAAAATRMFESMALWYARPTPKSTFHCSLPDYKPVSVPLRAAAIHLGRTLLSGSSDLPESS